MVWPNLTLLNLLRKCGFDTQLVLLQSVLASQSDFPIQNDETVIFAFALLRTVCCSMHINLWSFKRIFDLTQLSLRYSTSKSFRFFWRHPVFTFSVIKVKKWQTRAYCFQASQSVLVKKVEIKLIRKFVRKVHAKSSLLLSFHRFSSQLPFQFVLCTFTCASSNLPLLLLDYDTGMHSDGKAVKKGQECTLFTHQKNCYSLEMKVFLWIQGRGSFLHMEKESWLPFMLYRFLVS